MIAPTRSLSAWAVLFACLLPLPAQTTWIVGSGGFAQINDALAVAQAGDTILVQGGTYWPFTVTLGVQIVALGGATIAPGPQHGGTNLAPPNGQTAYVSGFTFVEYLNYTSYATVGVSSGQVVFDSCTFNGPHPYKGPWALSCGHADVVLIACSFSAWRSSVLINQGSLCATSCSFRGTDPLSQGTLNQMAALEVVSSKVQLSNCTLFGYSTAVASMQEAGFGLRVSGSSDVWLTDCVVTAGNTASSWTAAVPAVLSTSSRPVQYRNTTFVGGWGFLPNNGGPPVPVQAPGITGAAQAASLLGARLTGSWLEYSAVPSSAVMVGVSFGLALPTVMPPMQQPLRLVGLPVTTYAIGTTGANGLFVPQALPFMSSVFWGLPVWFHGVAFDGANLLAAPTIGRVVR